MKDNSDKKSINPFWEYLKPKCIDCYELNKHRTIHKDWKSFHIKSCPKHKAEIEQLWQMLKGRRLLHG